MSKQNKEIVESEERNLDEEKYKALEEKYKELEENFNQLEKKYTESEENNQKVLRTAAHVQNLYNEIKDKLPKEITKEKKKIKQDIFHHVIKFIDMLELTLTSINQQNNGDPLVKSIINGINMVHSYIINDLSNNFSLKKIPCKVGDFFDPNIHDGQNQIVTEDDNLHNTISKVVSNGYFLDNEPFTFSVVEVFIKN
jgi:molecular chaperone GrpE (heat shock protein)